MDKIKLSEIVKNIKQNNRRNTYGLSHIKIAEKLGLTRGQVWHLENTAIKKIAAYIIENNLSEDLKDYFDYKI